MKDVVPRAARAPLFALCALIALLPVACTPLYGDTRTSPSISHRFLACGGQTRIIEEDGRTSWTFPESTRDGQVLANGHVLLVLSRSDARPHGAVIEVVPNVGGDLQSDSGGETTRTGGRTVFEFVGTQSEINTAQRLANGNTMLVEAGDRPRVLEVDAKANVVREIPIRSQTANHHMESRMTRVLPSGNYLVPQLLDRVVREYAPTGEIVAEFRTPDEPADSWPFTAIRLPDGNTLVTCTHGNMVVEFDPKGAIVWQVSNADFATPLLNDPCGAQRLPNGNTVICSYAVGADRTKLLEITREKRVVWTFCEPEGPGVHEVHVLSTNGAPIAGVPLR